MMTFDDWVAAEQAKGLVNIEVSIKPGGTLTEVQNELLECEEQIRFGNVVPPPGPTTFLEYRIQQIIKSVTL